MLVVVSSSCRTTKKIPGLSKKHTLHPECRASKPYRGPRHETWAVYLVLLEWGGTYDLETITDASYTVSGMDFARRASNLREPTKISGRLSTRKSTTPPVLANSSAATVGGILRSPRSNRTATASTSTAAKLPSGRLASMTWPTKLRTYSVMTSATSISSEPYIAPRPNSCGSATG